MRSPDSMALRLIVRLLAPIYTELEPGETHPDRSQFWPHTRMASMTAHRGSRDAAYRSLRRLAYLRHALGPGPGRRRRQLQHRGFGIPLHRRPLGLRQVDLAQHHRGLSRTLRRRNPHRRQGRHRTRPRPWRGVPGLRPAFPVAHGARQRHLRSGDEGYRQGGARGDRARAAQAGEARKIRAAPIRTICPEGCNSGSPSRGRSRTIPRCC